MFGELALNTEKAKRSACIVCKDKCEFGIIDKANYERILRRVEEAKRMEINKFFQ